MGAEDETKLAESGAEFVAPETGGEHREGEVTIEEKADAIAAKVEEAMAQSVTDSSGEIYNPPVYDMFYDLQGLKDGEANRLIESVASRLGGLDTKRATSQEYSSKGKPYGSDPRDWGDKHRIDLTPVVGMHGVQLRRTFQDCITTGRMEPLKFVKYVKSPPAGMFERHDGREYRVPGRIDDSGGYVRDPVHWDGNTRKFVPDAGYRFNPRTRQIERIAGKKH